MFHLRVLLPVFTAAMVSGIPASAQSVISTHSGLVYFFEGSVSLGGQRLEQKFGRFPEVGEGSELRTDQGRAEVFLTPGVFLRIGDHSGLRMIANKLSETKVELVEGSGILESTEGASAAAVQLTYKHWQIRLPREGVCRVDSEPARVTVYKGEAQVSTGDEKPVAVRSGQTLPLAEVLVPEQSEVAGRDDFRNWAMSRSQAIASDNATAEGIVDDPSAMQSTADPLSSLTYFPLTGIPGLTVTNPYGVSFWSPYQAAMTAIYFPAYSYGYLYPTGWPTVGLRPILRPGLGLGSGLISLPAGSGSGLRLGSIPPRTIYTPLPSTPHPVMTRPMTTTHPVTAPHPAVAHPVGHR